MKAWGLKGLEVVTEYDAKQVEYWIRGVLTTLTFPKDDHEQFMGAFLASAAADAPETLAMCIAQGREAVRKTEKIWHAAVQDDGLVVPSQGEDPA